jgi:hypothetical protein
VGPAYGDHNDYDDNNSVQQVDKLGSDKIDDTCCPVDSPFSTPNFVTCWLQQPWFNFTAP